MLQHAGVTLNYQGFGVLEFSSDPPENGAPFQVNFPTLKAGSTIEIGNGFLQGTFTEAYFV